MAADIVAVRRMTSDGVRRCSTGCWVCDGTSRTPVHEAIFDLSEYATQDPELAAYSGTSVSIVRCGEMRVRATGRRCPRCRDTSIACTTSAGRTSGSSDEHHAGLQGRDLRRHPRRSRRAAGSGRRRLLDVGAHAGRFSTLARRAGWHAEGLELNPRRPRRSPRGQRRAASIRATCTRSTRAMSLRRDHADGRPRARARAPTVLRKARDSSSDGGWIAIKVPNGPAQRIKERVRRADPSRLSPVAGRQSRSRESLFAASLRLPWSASGFHDVTSTPARRSCRQREATSLDRPVAASAFRTVRAVPGGIHTPARVQSSGVWPT